MTVDTKMIRARADAATPGPLGVVRVEDHWGIFQKADDEAARVLVFWIEPTRLKFSSPEDAADAKFFAAARTDVPALCDEVDRLTAALAANERERDTLMSTSSTAKLLGEARRALAAAEAREVALRESLGHALTCRECAETSGCESVRDALAAPTDETALGELLLRVVGLCGGRDDMTDEAVVDTVLRGDS